MPSEATSAGTQNGTEADASEQPRRTRVLITAHTLEPPGGASAVGAWAIQALREQYELEVLTWRDVDLEATNRAFGTSLEVSDAIWRTVPRSLRLLVALAPVPAALLGLGLGMRHARRLDQIRHYDAMLGTMNELDVGRPAIQYVHYPWYAFPRPAVNLRWYHWRPAVVAYRTLATAAAGYRPERAAKNITLVNSEWTGRVFERCYGTAVKTLYPPVAGGFPRVPFEKRHRGFVMIGRLSPEKEVEKVIDIIGAVREHGHDLTLDVVGHVDHRRYAERLFRDSRGHPWVRFHLDLPRSELTRLVATRRYGIHGMVGEHFGIAPAELQRAGCITFVPDEGGQAEIVGGDEKLTYGSAAEAVAKIRRVVSDPANELVLHARALERGELFSEERFMCGLRSVVSEFTQRCQG